MDQEKLVNCLVAYQGGGYDGCFWEWNFCGFDENGEFYDIYSSGSMGIDNKDDLLKYFQENEEHDDYYVYSLDSEDEIDDFCKNHAKGNVMRMIKWFEENKGENPFYLYCGECGGRTDEPMMTGYTGDGGIGTRVTDVVCSDCYYSNVCDNCGEYVAPEEGLKEYNDEYLCEYCYDKATEKEDQEKK